MPTLPRPCRAASVAVAAALLATACASEKTTEPAPAGAASPSPSPTAAATATATATPTVSSAALPNACPAEGCSVRIVGVRTAGTELELDLEANFAPDISNNHFHVYWDRFTAEQVSDDAAPRFGVTQGDWVPTDVDPYTTADAASLSRREGAARICVTAGDRDHNVLDPKLFQCHDVGAGP